MPFARSSLENTITRAREELIHPASDPKRVKLDLGGCTVTLLDGGRLRLDGGAMFGIIPRALWSRRVAADEQNRIELACNCLLVEWAGERARRVIVETGHGPKFAGKDQKIFAIDPSRWLLTDLDALGVDRSSITDVILSHLHFDHAGGLTMIAEPEGQTSGNVLPTFPKARIHARRREFDDARTNFGIMKFTYREENFAPLDSADAWNLFDGDGSVVEGIRTIATPGHTPGHQSIVINGLDRSAVFVGDVMPMHHHVGRPYNMAYDVLPLDNANTKRELLRSAVERDWLLILDHDPEMPVVRVARDGEWYTLMPAD